jgi:RND family efflux transporter MFP subunit
MNSHPPSSSLASCLLLSLLLQVPAAPAAEPIRLNETQVRSLAITTQVIAATPGSASSRLPARVEVPISQMRVVATPVAASVDALIVVPGMAVRRGQTLARLSSPQILQLQREVLQAAAQNRLMEDSLRRDEQLYAEGLIAQSRLQATRAGAAQAAAQSAEAARSLQMAGAGDERMSGTLQLSSPIDGIVLEQSAQLGQRLEAGGSLYKVARLSPLWVEIQVPMSIATGLKIGGQVQVVQPQLQARIVAVEPGVDPGSQSRTVRAEVGKGAERLAPGAMVEVELIGVATGGHTLPHAAVVRHNDRSLVFVRNSSGAYLPRAVTLLGEGGGMAQVDGLKDGEAVVVGGASGLKAMLRDGAQ